MRMFGDEGGEVLGPFYNVPAGNLHKNNFGRYRLHNAAFRGNSIPDRLGGLFVGNSVIRENEEIRTKRAGAGNALPRLNTEEGSFRRDNKEGIFRNKRGRPAPDVT